MANKVIKHYYESVEAVSSPNPPRPEPDKTKTISELSSPEIYQMLERLRSERELQSLIRELKRNSGQRDTYDNPFKIDTKTPINQLYHFGITGQKWGVRRYQNEDGTRTPVGKKRDAQSIPKSEDHKISREARSRATEGLSNDELKKLNERLRLEADYRNLTTEKMQKSESFVKRAIKSGGEQALSEFSKTVFLGSAKLLVKQVSPEFAEAVFKAKPTAVKDKMADAKAKAQSIKPQPGQPKPQPKL